MKEVLIYFDLVIREVWLAVDVSMDEKRLYGKVKRLSVYKRLITRKLCPRSASATYCGARSRHLNLPSRRTPAIATYRVRSGWGLGKPDPPPKPTDFFLSAS